MEKAIKINKNRILAFISAFAIIFSVFGFSICSYCASGFVPNGSTYPLVTIFDIDNTFNTASAYDNEFGFDSATTPLQTKFETALSQDLPYVYMNSNNMSDYQAYWDLADSYLCYFDSSNGNPCFMFPSEGSFVVKDEHQHVYLAYRNFTSLPNLTNYSGVPACAYFTCPSGSTVWTYSVSNTLNVSIDGDNSYGFIPITDLIVNTNLELRVSDVDLTQGNSFSTSQFSAVNNPNSKFNKDDIVNHLTLGDGTLFYLTNNSFDNGTLYCYPEIDNTQLDSSESLENYYLRIEGSSTYSLDYMPLGNIKLKYGKKYLHNIYSFDSNSTNNFSYSLVSNSGDYIDIPISDVSSGAWSMSLSEVNKSFLNRSTDNRLSVITSSLDNTYGSGGYWQFLPNIISNTSVMGFKFDLNNYVSGEYDIVPVGASYHFDLYVVKKDATTGAEDKGMVQSVIDCNFVTGSYSAENVNTSNSEQVKQAIGTDYLPNDYLPATNYDGNYGGSLTNSSGNSSATGGSSSSTGGNNTIGDGAIVINNNPTFNNNSGGGSGVTQANESTLGTNNAVISKIISLIAQNKTSSVDEMEELTGVNAWLTVIQTTWSFIPAEVWTVLLVTFTTSMGIMIVTFIIRLVYNFVT